MAKYKNLMQVLLLVICYLVLQHMFGVAPFAERLGNFTSPSADATKIRSLLVTMQPSSQCMQDVRSWVHVMVPILQDDSMKQIEQAMSNYDGKLGRVAVEIKLGQLAKNPPPACDKNIVLWYKNYTDAYLSIRDGFVMWEQYMFVAGLERVKMGVAIIKVQADVINDIFRPYAVE